ncbi:MAG: response regulator [Kofleriaceae bacterium]|nr:response regulator [Kofleriaceae bacterium]MBP6838975.1 response regulator [Kofleriaceae bacterium]MBP9204755.1 response regulator [Kofleriaceae bacterium]
MRALVIDDSLVMRKMIGKILKQVGYEPTDAKNGEDGLAVLAAGGVDLCMVDWNMPVMDGLAFIKAVRADPRHAGLPVVMVTSEAEAERAAEAMAAGATAYIVKPFDADTVRGTLQGLGVAA